MARATEKRGRKLAPCASAAPELAGVAQVLTEDPAAFVRLVEAIATKSHPMTCKGCRNLVEAVAGLLERSRAMPVRPIKQMGKVGGVVL